MSLFNINYPNLVRLLVPKPLRQTKTLAWLDVLVSPVVYLYNLFMAARAANLYFINHTSQVVKMEAVLNDRYDPGLRRILIVDGPDVDPLFIYVRAEGKDPKYLYLASESQPQYIYRRTETANGPDFVVEVPGFITYDLNEIKALINKYRLPSKGYYLITNV